MGTRRRPRAALALIATGALAFGATGLTGCATPGPSTSNARTLTVPALWTATDADGQPTGGIEPATITVATVGAPGFGLSLADDEARGAGPQWLAASASAASLATLLSGADPRFVDIDYAVTGPIDGPSAGAILTVGTLAALTGRALDADVTMTGTISPNGAIGPVAGVAAKMRTASAAGFARVLVPVANLAEAQAARADIDIIGVRTVDEAFAAFTGRSIVESPPVAPAMTPAVRQVAGERAATMVTAASADAAMLPADVDAGTAAPAYALIAGAQTALTAGDETAAYGLGLGARLTVAPAGAATRVTTPPTDDARRLREQADGIVATTTERIGATSRTWATNIGQQAALASVVAANAAVRATAAGVARAELSSTDQRAAAAGILAEQTLLAEVAAKDDVAVVAAMSRPDATPLGEEAAMFASGYTDFLVRAARANRDYARQVLKTAADATVLGSSGLLAASSEALRALDAIRPHTQPLPEEIEQIGLAIAAYVLSGELVDALQGQGSATASDAAGAALTAMTRDFLGWATKRGVEVGYPLWQTGWARSLDDSGLTDRHVQRVADQATAFALITSAMLDAVWTQELG